MRHPPHRNHLDRMVEAFGFLLLDPIPGTALKERRARADDIGSYPLGRNSPGQRLRAADLEHDQSEAAEFAALGGWTEPLRGGAFGRLFS